MAEGPFIGDVVTHATAVKAALRAGIRWRVPLGYATELVVHKGYFMVPVDENRQRIHLVLGSGEPITLATGMCWTAPSWGVWTRYIKSNGVVTTELRCLHCGCRLIDGGKAADDCAYPVLVDNRTDACERCASRGGVELHHWAPRHLFDDADGWPTSNLCRPCHQEWHRVVTPNMGQKRVS